MKTITNYEVGDKVKVTATKPFGICFTNKHGGTSEYTVNKPLNLTITKTWGDYETGRRHIGKTSKGKEYYFGEFSVTIEG